MSTKPPETRPGSPRVPITIGAAALLVGLILAYTWRWSSDDAIAFLETKARWLDAALESWESDGEAIADESDLIEAKAVVLVVPEPTGQPLRTDLLDVLIPVDS